MPGAGSAACTATVPSARPSLRWWRSRSAAGNHAADGGPHLSGGDPPGDARGDGAGRARLRARGRRRDLRRRLPCHRGVPREVRREAGHRHPDQRDRHRGRGHRRLAHGHASDRGDAVHRLHLVRVRHHRQQRGQDAVPLGAAEAAARDGIDVEVVDLRTLLPLDDEAILSTAAKTGKVIVLHEPTITGGLGGEIAALVSERAFEYLDAPVMRVAPPDTPVPYSPPLEETFLPNAAKVGEAIRAIYDY